MRATTQRTDFYGFDVIVLLNFHGCGEFKSRRKQTTACALLSLMKILADDVAEEERCVARVRD